MIQAAPSIAKAKFQHTAARRRLPLLINLVGALRMFQHTAARRRLTAKQRPTICQKGFNTQPPEGGWIKKQYTENPYFVSTHSRPKAAAPVSLRYPSGRQFQHTAARRRLAILAIDRGGAGGFNTQPPEGGCCIFQPFGDIIQMFQHTAARRRLFQVKKRSQQVGSFNTQPPEGGWSANCCPMFWRKFQHTAARRRLFG